MSGEQVEHKVELSEDLWFATQSGRGVQIYQRFAPDGRLGCPYQRFTPPISWGKSWRWNISEHGITFYRP